MKRYEVADDADRMMPKWMADHIDYMYTKMTYRVVDGALKLKGIKVDGVLARIGDVVTCEKGIFSVERR